jgi:hypothetical protein
LHSSPDGATDGAILPDHKEDLIQAARTDRAFRAQIVLLGEIGEGSRQKSFLPSVVRSRRTTGLKYSISVGVVDADEFLDKMAMPPPTDEKQAKFRMIKYLNQELGRAAAALHT